MSEGPGKTREGEGAMASWAVEPARRCWLERIPAMPAGRQRAARTSRDRAWRSFSRRRSEHAGGAWSRFSLKSRDCPFRFRHEERTRKVCSMILSIEAGGVLRLPSGTRLDPRRRPTPCDAPPRARLLRDRPATCLLAGPRRLRQHTTKTRVSRARRVEVEPDLDPTLKFVQILIL